MNNRYRWLWIAIKIATLYGLLWLHYWLYGRSKFSWIIVVAIALAWDWFVQPPLEKWIKRLVKQAIREKELEDDEYEQEQALKDADSRMG